ncbi:MAG: hypothetical protein HYR72_21785 [Deltaproteobacteria bacterium]|nr:hypothetical protein [Deltaproteobacteria bacterium]MBI3390150.1 hypothetical protein [Deltaproteobacteria bacterium]
MGIDDVSKQKIEACFPQLKRGGYKITSPDTRRYNCHAWAAEDDRHWWQPSPYGGLYWPLPLTGSDDETLDGYTRAFGSRGYSVCDDGGHEAGFEKIAIYVDHRGMPSHTARQNGPGIWTSKLGDLEDIEHVSLEALAGPEPAYGTVTRFMKRKRK